MEVEIREPRPGERVILVTLAAAELGLSRQAVDHAVRRGRLPGFKDPRDRRLYADLDRVEEIAGGMNLTKTEQLATLSVSVKELRDVIDGLVEQNDGFERALRLSERRSDQIQAFANGLLDNIQTLRDALQRDARSSS